MGILTTILHLLGDDRYSAHALCLSNDRIIMTLFAGANLLTSLSYIAMGSALTLYATRILHISPQVKALFGAFIFLCGLHHACEVLTLFVGVYRLELIVDMMMAGVSAGTAIFTITELPKLFVAAGPAE